MANRFNKNMQRRPGGGFNNFDRRFNVNPWQGGMGPNPGNMGPNPNTEATIALANNIMNIIEQSRQTQMPSLMDINVRRDFGPNYMRDERFGPNKIYGRNMQMGGQMNRRLMSGGRNDRIQNKIRRPTRPIDNNKAKPIKKDDSEPKAENVPESGDLKQEDVVIQEVSDENETSGTTANVSNEGKPADDDGIKKQDGMKTEFDDIQAKYLECHICEKKMWDGRSFDNHIKGRVHNIMMEKTKQSYHMTADAMRQELKIQEMKRTKRGFVPGAKRVFCAMCDLQVFYAAAHRRSPGHQKLKKYLHPSCNTCRKEFPTRIEFDEHRLTASHLRLLQEKQKDVQTRVKPEVVMITTLQEELAHVRPIHEFRNKKTNVTKKEGENEESAAEGNVENANGEAEAETAEVVKKEEEEEKFMLLDYKEGDDLTNITKENLPKYQTDRVVGMSFISDFTCKQCTLCRKFFDTDETAEVHLRTWKHFQSYIRLIHSKGNFKNNQETANKRENEDSDKEDSDTKRIKVEESLNDSLDETLLNGSDVGENDDVCDEATMIEIDEILHDSNEIKEELNTQEQVKDEKIEVETDVTVARPAVLRRGRGRGRGGRRGRY